MKLHQLLRISGPILAALLFAAFAAPTQAHETNPGQAVPGTINYLEGVVSIGSQPLDAKSIGSAELKRGDWGPGTHYVQGLKYSGGVYRGPGCAR